MRRAAPWLVALVVAWAPVAAGAEEPAPPPPPDQPTLPRVEREVPPAEVEAVRPAELPSDPTSFTTVIRPDDYAGEHRSVEDLLALSPGVQVRRFGGPGQPSEISIRGSTSRQVVVLLDGVRLNGAQSGAVDLSTLPSDLVDRIEVVRGGGSAQVGSDAIGGVVNIVTKRPGAKPRTTLSGEAGSFGSWEGSALHARRQGDVEITAGYDGFKTDGDFEFVRPVVQALGQTFHFQPEQIERVNDRSENHFGLLRIGRNLGDTAHVELQNALTYTSRGQPGLDSGDGVTGGQQLFAHERRTRSVTALHLEGADVAKSGVDSDAAVYHRYERIRFTDPQSSLCGAIDTENNNYTVGGQAGLERTFTALGASQRVSLNGDLREDRLTSTEFANVSRLAGGVVLQDDVSVFEGKVRAVPALRWDATEDQGTKWVPRFGAEVLPLPWLRLKGNVERSYRVANFDERFMPDRCFLRGNPNLRPEDAINFDAGLEIAFAALGPFHDVRAAGAWFQNDVDDSIVFVLVSPFTVTAVNTGPATVKGAEGELGFGLFQWTRFSASGTWLDATLDRTGTPLPGRAKAEATLRLVVGPPSGLVKLTGEAHYTGEIPVSDTGRTVLPARTVYDASVVVDLAKLGFVAQRVPVEALRVSLLGRNLTDRAVRDAQFFPQPGRTLALRVETSW